MEKVKLFLQFKIGDEIFISLIDFILNNFIISRTKLFFYN